MTIEEMKHIKEERGYSFAQLADYSGVPMGTIQKIFGGVTRNPRPATLNALERVLAGEEKTYAGRAYTYELNGVRICSEIDMVKETAAVYAEKKGPGDYTLKDYYGLPEDRRVELIDGVFYDMSSPNLVHQSLLGLLHVQVATFIRRNKGACKVWMAPVDVQLDCDDKTMVQPDLIILCDPEKRRDFGIYGAPDFVLEILSSSTSKKDRFLKTYKYSNAGVREYWIIDPKRRTLITYDFTEEDEVRTEMPLRGRCGLSIYSGELEIDLDELAAEIEEMEAAERKEQ